MSNIVIRRCPVCNGIRKHAQEALATLEHDLGVDARIEDGAKGEFSVLVDGAPVLQRGGDSLPSMDEVEAAVANAAPAPMGV